jgi:hypothetical protein
MIKFRLRLTACALTLLLSVQAFCQKSAFFHFRHYYNKAQLLLFNGDYKNSKKNFEKSFKYFSHDKAVNIGYFGYINCLLLNKDTLKAVEAEKSFLAMGMVDLVSPSSITNKFGNNYGKEIVNDFPRLKAEHEKSMTDTKRLIISMENRDQTARDNKNNGLTSAQIDKGIELADSINFYQLRKVAQDKNANPICLVLYHMYGKYTSQFPFYDSIYKEKVFSGEADPSAYVQWFDRQRMYVEKLPTQLYGEWNEFGSKEFNPIDDIKNIDKRRAALGLCSLRDYALIHNMNLPRDYVFKKK